MDIRKKIEELVSKLQSDKDLLKKFEADPVPVIEKLVGIDLPDEQINQLVEGIRAKLNLDKLGGALGGLGGLFGKK
nr:hypothetical protein [bacterium]